MADFVVNKNCDFSRSITYQDNTNTPINLTGYTAKMEVKGSLCDEDTYNILSLSSVSGGITLGGATGVITITITAAQLTEPTLDLENIKTISTLTDVSGITGKGKIAYYDLLLTSPSNITTPLISGRICFNQTITRN